MKWYYNYQHILTLFLFVKKLQLLLFNIDFTLLESLIIERLCRWVIVIIKVFLDHRAQLEYHLTANQLICLFDNQLMETFDQSTGQPFFVF